MTHEAWRDRAARAGAGAADGTARSRWPMRAIVATLWAVAASGAWAQPATRTVVVDQRRLLAGRQTLDDHRRSALDDALAEAVRQAVGTKIEAMQQRLQSEERSALEDRFLSVVNTGAAGRVVDYQVLVDSLERVPARDGQSLTYLYLRVSAKVAPERGTPDPGFKVSVELNRQVFADRAPPGEADEIIATVRVTKDAYITIFGVSDDTVQVLLPNALVRQNLAHAGESMQFPSEAQRQQMGLIVRASLAPNRTQATELYAVVATKQPIPFDGVVSGDGVQTVRGTMLALNRWLVTIPLEQRAIAWSGYEIRRAAP